MTDFLTILIADDHDLILQGISLILKENIQGVNIITSKSGKEALQQFYENKIELLISDISMQGMDGIELCRSIRKLSPLTRILVITQIQKIWILQQLFQIKVHGILYKEESAEVIIKAVKNIMRGNTFYSLEVCKYYKKFQKDSCSLIVSNIILTTREQEIIELIASEKTNNEIADILEISLKTIEAHRKNLFIKFNVKNSVGLIRKAIDLGFVN